MDIRNQQLETIKKWIKGLYENDHNNSVFETYNEHCDYNNKERLIDSRENLEIIINDNEFIEEILDIELENGMFKFIIEDLKNWGE